MVEVFLAVRLKPQELTDMLCEAVNLRPKDLVKLLIDHGADVRSVPFERVLYEWQPGGVNII